jgi:hypothetical protein
MKSICVLGSIADYSLVLYMGVAYSGCMMLPIWEHVWIICYYDELCMENDAKVILASHLLLSICRSRTCRIKCYDVQKGNQQVMLLCMFRNILVKRNALIMNAHLLCISEQLCYSTWFRFLCLCRLINWRLIILASVLKIDPHLEDSSYYNWSCFTIMSESIKGPDPHHKKGKTEIHISNKITIPFTKYILPSQFNNLVIRVHSQNTSYHHSSTI